MSTGMTLAVRARAIAPVRVCVIALPLALASLAVAAPVLLSHGYVLSEWTVRAFFASICHQDPERSFAIGGYTVAVCARCFGIYVGALIGAFVRVRRAAAMRWLVVALLFSAADAALEFAGEHGSWAGFRFVLGAGLGAAIAALVVGGRSEPQITRMKATPGARLSDEASAPTWITVSDDPHICGKLCGYGNSD